MILIVFQGRKGKGKERFSVDVSGDLGSRIDKL